jgi:hypothetical protein
MTSAESVPVKTILPAGEPNYRAAHAAYRRVTAYWAPELIDSPEHFSKLLDAMLAAAGETCDASAREPAVDQFMEIVVHGSALIRDCAKGYGEPVPWMASHDAAKRFYRMGWRKVAPSELSTCAHCGAENVVTAQSVCIDCVGKPSSSVPTSVVLAVD